MTPDTPTRKLRSDGLAFKLRQFFDANPGEELTLRDVMDKWGVRNTDTVFNALRKLDRVGAGIERVDVIRPRPSTR